MNKQTRRFVFGFIMIALNSYVLKHSLKRIIDLDYSWTYDYILSSMSLICVLISVNKVVRTLN